MGIAWDKPPQRRGGDYIQIFRARETGSDCLLLLGPGVGVDTHWIDAERKTLPCRGDTCRHCLADNPKRWRGYYPAVRLVGSSPVPVIFEVTEQSALRLNERGELRGVAIEVSRSAKRGPIVIRFEDYDRWSKYRPRMPAAFDVRAVLLRMWNVNEQDEPKQTEEKMPAVVPFRKQA